MPDPRSPEPIRLSRRGALGLFGAGAAGVAVGAGGAWGAQSLAGPGGPTEKVIRQTYSPYGAHQAGITTPVPAATRLVAYDLHDDVDAAALGRLMRLWSGDIRRLMLGEPVTGDRTPYLATPRASLTLTVGFGPRVFELPGLARHRPDGFLDIPPMVHDDLDQRWCGGDLVVLASADDATTLDYALESLTRDGATFCSVRWSQAASWRGSDMDGRITTGRNLFGQLDGSGNPRGADLDAALWETESPAWFVGGTQLVVRRIEMRLDEWNKLTANEQEIALGRGFAHGAPLSGGDEFTTPDFEARDADGRPAIAPNSHVAMAHPVHNRGRTMHRRSMNYTHTETVDGQARDTTGLLFLAFVRNIANQFIPVQQRLDGGDELNNWTTAIGSAVFAMPPGFAEGSSLAAELLP